MNPRGAYSNEATWASFAIAQVSLRSNRSNLSGLRGIRVILFIDDITVILSPKLSLVMTMIETFTKWIQQRLEVDGIPLKLLAMGILPKYLMEEQRIAAVDIIGLAVVG